MKHIVDFNVLKGHPFAAYTFFEPTNTFAVKGHVNLVRGAAKILDSLCFKKIDFHQDIHCIQNIFKPLK